MQTDMNSNEKTPTLPDVQRMLDLKVSQISEIAQESVLSVYHKKNNSRENAAHIGTAFIFNYRSSQYLATAFHVFQQASQDGKPTFLSKSGKSFELAQIQDLNASAVFSEEFDFYITKTIPDPAGISGISLDEKACEAPYPICLSLGYPNSRNKKRIDEINKAAESTILSLTLSEQKANGEKLSSPDGSPYFSLDWQKKALDEEWQESNALNIRGMSGGPCLRIKFDEEDVVLQNWTVTDAQLIGMLIEKNDRGIKFIKFSKMREHLTQ